MNYTAADAHAAVARGAAWLDERRPDWFTRIDLAKLDMVESDVCILGQTAGCLVGPAPDKDDNVWDSGYWRVLSALDLGTKSWPSEHGFKAPGEDRVEYEMLGIAWRELIRQRLAVPA